MRVAIDVSPLKTGHKFRGIGFYTERLVKAIKKFDKENEYVFIDHRSSVIDHQFDLIHYPYFDLFFLTLPIKKPAPVAVTIHDVIPLVFPEHYPKGLKGWCKLQRQKLSLKNVRVVITDSQNSKKDIVKYLGFSKDKIFVVPLAPGEEFRLIKSTPLLYRIREKYKLPDTFVLYVGDVNWNKNIPGLIKAFKTIERLNNEAMKLVLVSKALEDRNLPETKTILRLIKELGLNNRIKILGFVPTKDLVAIYNLAAAYCQPSFYEGFGLPVLEAMACGTPVVCSKTSSLPEVVGDAAIFVDPKDIKSIAQGIKHVIENEEVKETFRKKSISRASQFSWKKTAEKTIGVYKKILRKQ